MRVLRYLTLIALLLIDRDESAAVSKEEEEKQESSAAKPYLRRGLNSIGFVSISLPAPPELPLDDTATTTATTPQAPPDHLLDIINQDPNEVWDISSFNQYIPGNERKEPNITLAPTQAPTEPYPTCEELLLRLSGNYSEDFNSTWGNYSNYTFTNDYYSYHAEDHVNNTNATNATEEVGFNTTYYSDWTEWCHNETNNTMYVDMHDYAVRRETFAPTFAPSDAPSTVPTFSTAAPTLVPSAYPSVVPTTFAPTEQPSRYPTKSPTTKKPTQQPTPPPPTHPPTPYPTKAPTTPKPTPTPKPTQEPSASPTKFPTLNPTAGRGCGMCKDGSFPPAGDKTVLVRSSGERVTCGDLDRAEEASVLRNQFCLDFNGTVNGIHLESYCECPTVVVASRSLCGDSLCPGTMLDETMIFEGMTCKEWDDVARSAADKSVCNHLMMTPGPINYCCKQEMIQLGTGLG